MKKLSKILAALLTSCVLLGFSAFFASADTADYREYEYDFDTLSGANVPAGVLNAWTSNADGTKLSSIAELASNSQVTAGDNTYTRFYAVTGNAAAYADYNTQAQDANYKIKDYKYAVVQFLFGAEGGNYVDGAYIKPMVSVSNSNFGAIKIVRHSDGKYYAEGGYDSTTAVKSAPLTEVDGDWNVLTMVIKPRHNNSNAVGTDANFAVYYYVNGVHVANRIAGNAVDLGHVYALRVGRLASTNVSAGDNIMLDGYNARFYLNGLNIANNTYTTPDFQGIDDIINSYATADITQCKDIKYNAYSTTKDFPSTLDKNGNIHEQSGAKVYIGDVGYMDAAGAFMNLKENETAKIYGDVTITGVAAKNYKVEVYNNAKVNFGGDVTSSSNILPGERDGITRYVVSPRRAINCIEYTNNVDRALSGDGFASNIYRTWTSNATGVQSTVAGAVATANGNSYWRMFATTTTTNSGAVNGGGAFTIGGTNAPADTYTDEDALNFKYTATEYLFMAEGLNYPNGMSIEIRTDYKQSGATKGFGRVYIIEKDGAWYASADGSTAGVPLSTVEGAWNMVSQVSEIKNANKEARTATVVTHIFVNGSYLTSNTVQNGVIGSMTSIAFYGHKNSSATPGDNICVDGISIRNFGSLTEDYKTDDFYGIDDFFTDYNNNVEGAAPVYCEDTVYNINTTFLPATGGEQDFRATINGVYNFLYAESALFYAKDNDVITLNTDYFIQSLPAGIKKLSFNGTGVVTVSDDILTLYTFFDGSLVKNVQYTVNWLLAEGEAPFLSEELIYTLTSPKTPNPELLTVTTDILGNYNTYLAWQYKVGDGVYKPLSDFELCDDGDTVTIIPRITTVNWYHANGNLKLTELWFVGSVIDKQENDLYGGGAQNNGWYEIVYGWDSTEFTAVPGTLEYRQVMAPVSAVDIKFNFTLEGELAPTYYVLAPLENVKIKSILASTGNGVYDYKNSYEKVKIGGADYYMYNLGGVSLADYDAVYSFQVIYDIEVEGLVYTLESRVVKTSIAYEDAEVTAYAKVILQGEGAECSKTSELAAALIELVRQTYALENDDTIDAIIDSYIASHTAQNAECTCFGGAADALPKTADSKASYSKIANIGGEIYYNLTEYGPILTVKLPKTLGTKQELSVSASLVGIDVNDITKKNQDNRIINVKFRCTGEDGEFFIYTANTASINIYNAANLQKITVSCKGKSIASGAFSLSEYVYRMNKTYEFYTWSNVDLDNDGNVDGYKLNSQPIGTREELEKFEAFLAYLNFSKKSEEYMRAE